MIQELDTVVLTRDVREHNLAAGDIGAVVHAHGDGAAFEVEFVTAGGQTIAVLTLSAAEIRPMRPTEILGVRETDSKAALLRQAGALADDESLPELLAAIYRERGRPETEEG